MDIRCRKTDCVYNELLTCRADKIEIKDELECACYKKDSEKEIDISKQIFEGEPEIAPYRHNKDLCLKCKADCLFNNNHNCIANGITVNDVNDCALCITFMKK